MLHNVTIYSIHGIYGSYGLDRYTQNPSTVTTCYNQQKKSMEILPENYSSRPGTIRLPGTLFRVPEPSMLP